MADLHPEQRAALRYIETHGTRATVESILGRLDRTLHEASELLEDLPAERARRRPPGGGWSVLEVVDHLAVSHEQGVDDLRELIAGREPRNAIPAGLQSEDVDSLPWPRVRDRFDEIHQSLRSLLANTNDGTPHTAVGPVVMVVKCQTPDGVKPIHWVQSFDWKAQAIILRIHVQEHLAQIRRILKA